MPPIEFYGSGKELLAIQDAWKINLSHMKVSEFYEMLSLKRSQG